MRSSISNFKERLRLPRLFFRKPSREEQIHGGPPLEFERPIPPAPWRQNRRCYHHRCHRCDRGVGVILPLARLYPDAQR